MTNLKESRIYVGTYGQYNNGSLHGKWFDLSDYSDKEEFEDAITEFHRGVKNAEFMFQDWENIPSNLISESWVSERVWDILDEVSDTELPSYTVFVENFDGDYQDYQDAFLGEYNSIEDFIWEYLDEMGTINAVESAGLSSSYIDLEAIERDWFNYGEYHFIDGFVFRY